MKKKLVFLICLLSTIFSCIAEDFLHKYIFYNFNDEMRLQKIVTNIFDDNGYKIKTIYSNVGCNQEIENYETIDYVYEENFIYEYQNGIKYHGYKLNDKKQICEEYFYEDNKIDIFNTKLYFYENDILIKKRNYLDNISNNSEYDTNYIYNVNNQLIEMTKCFDINKYEYSDGLLVKEISYQSYDNIPEVESESFYFYNYKNQLIREEIVYNFDPLYLAEFFDGKEYKEIIFYDYLK